METIFRVYMDGVGRFWITSEEIEDNLGYVFSGTQTQCERYIKYQNHEVDTLEDR